MPIADAYKPPESDLTQLETSRIGPLYSQKQVAAAAFFATFAAVFWVMGANYREMGNEGARRICIVVGIVGTLAYLGLSFLIPDDVPTLAFAVFNVGSGYYLADRLQGEIIDEHRERNGPLRSNWRLIGVSLVCALLLLLAIAAIAIFYPFILPGVDGLVPG